MTKEIFVKALKIAGVNDAQLKKFHETLEQKHPAEHEELLNWLGIDKAKQLEIREASR